MKEKKKYWHWADFPRAIKQQKSGAVLCENLEGLNTQLIKGDRLLYENRIEGNH